MINKIITFFKRKFGAKPARIESTINPFAYGNPEDLTKFLESLIPGPNCKEFWYPPADFFKDVDFDHIFDKINCHRQIKPANSSADSTSISNQ